MAYRRIAATWALGLVLVTLAGGWWPAAAKHTDKSKKAAENAVDKAAEKAAEAAIPCDAHLDGDKCKTDAKCKWCVVYLNENDVAKECPAKGRCSTTEENCKDVVWGTMGKLYEDIPKEANAGKKLAVVARPTGAGDPCLATDSSLQTGPKTCEACLAGTESTPTKNRWCQYTVELDGKQVSAGGECFLKTEECLTGDNHLFIDKTSKLVPSSTKIDAADKCSPKPTPAPGPSTNSTTTSTAATTSSAVVAGKSSAVLVACLTAAATAVGSFFVPKF